MCIHYRPQNRVKHCHPLIIPTRNHPALPVQKKFECVQPSTQVFRFGVPPKLSDSKFDSDPFKILSTHPTLVHPVATHASNIMISSWNLQGTST